MDNFSSKTGLTKMTFYVIVLLFVAMVLGSSLTHIARRVGTGLVCAGIKGTNWYDCYDSINASVVSLEKQYLQQVGLIRS